MLALASIVILSPGLTVTVSVESVQPGGIPVVIQVIDGDVMPPLTSSVIVIPAVAFVAL